MRELVHASTSLLCIKNDLYTEVPFGGKKLNRKYARYFKHDDKQMLIIYDERAVPYIVEIIKGMPKGSKIKIYLFSYSGYAYDDEFEEVEDKVELCALPQAIYNAYQRVLPKRKPKFEGTEIIEDIEENQSIEPDGLFSLSNEDGKEETK